VAGCTARRCWARPARISSAARQQLRLACPLQAFASCLATAANGRHARRPLAPLITFCWQPCCLARRPLGPVRAWFIRLRLAPCVARAGTIVASSFPSFPFPFLRSPHQRPRLSAIHSFHTEPASLAIHPIHTPRLPPKHCLALHRHTKRPAPLRRLGQVRRHRLESSSVQPFPGYPRFVPRWVIPELG